MAKKTKPVESDMPTEPTVETKQTKAIIDGWWRVTGDFIVDVVVGKTEEEAIAMFRQCNRLAADCPCQCEPMEWFPQKGTDAICYVETKTAEEHGGRILMKMGVQEIPDWKVRTAPVPVKLD